MNAFISFEVLKFQKFERDECIHFFFFWFSVIVKRAKVVCKVLQKFWHSSFIVFGNMPLETFLKNSCCNGNFLIYVFFNDHEWRWSPRMVGMVIWRGIALCLYILNTNRMYFKLTAPNMKSIFFLNVKYRINWLLLLNIQWQIFHVREQTNNTFDMKVLQSVSMWMKGEKLYHYRKHNEIVYQDRNCTSQQLTHRERCAAHSHIRSI